MLSLSNIESSYANGTQEIGGASDTRDIASAPVSYESTLNIVAGLEIVASNAVLPSPEQVSAQRPLTTDAKAWSSLFLNPSLASQAMFGLEIGAYYGT
ncbi:uncharacterized protein KGF55_001382 [Candida pseudojiufengensis]|uniref:uncharacterized protein n=1 Tax=Candida pseudojiufengensis TaxID=497109 RepID=UPI00222498AD|nr:uncharacterized protein KGF55_001382 [Candida pseudojiufengensis]KAI5965162.1 hypothetical protein KGF55_001382 [Candida pseudojiufengensis]